MGITPSLLSVESVSVCYLACTIGHFLLASSSSSLCVFRSDEGERKRFFLTHTRLLDMGHVSVNDAIKQRVDASRNI